MKINQLIIALSLSLSASAFAQKTFSVLGDSYSTFDGKNNLKWADMWYRHSETPNPKNDVNQYEQTWWSLLDADPDFKLDTNNSWSGSTICLTGYNQSDYCDRAFITRINNIGDPDIILIFGGTNDSWANAPIGEYKYSDWTNKDLFSFRPAFAYLLFHLQALYPNAKLYNIVNTGLKPEIYQSIDDISEHYNVTNIYLKDIDKQHGHPSVKGMQDIMTQVKAAMVNE